MEIANKIYLTTLTMILILIALFVGHEAQATEPKTIQITDEITMQSPVYIQGQNSVLERFKRGIGRLAQDTPKDAGIPLKTLSDKEMKCLGVNVYYESRGESDLGQKAVAHVTLNRLHNHKYPDTICRVVYQRGQFSWVKGRKNVTPKSNPTLDKSMRLARVAYYHNQLGIDPTNGALFFNTTHFQSGIRIGNHGFY